MVMVLLPMFSAPSLEWIGRGSLLRLRHGLRPVIAFDERRVVRRHHGVEPGKLTRVRTVPGAVRFAQYGVRRSHDYARLREARYRHPRRHLAWIAGRVDD